MWLYSKFETLRVSILHLYSLTESVAEFTSEETRLRMLSSPALVQSASFLTALAAPYHFSIFRGPLNHGPPSRGPENWGQQTCESITHAQQVTCRYYKQLCHMVSTCPKRERLYGPFVLRSSVAVSAPAPALQSSAGSSSDQLSQIASYLTQNLGIIGASLSSDFTAMFATSKDSTPWINDSYATHHMIFDHYVLTHYSHVFCIPKLTTQLLYVSKITDHNCNVLFIPISCIIQDHTGRKIRTGRKVNDLYWLEYLHLLSSAYPAVNFLSPLIYNIIFWVIYLALG